MAPRSFKCFQKHDASVLVRSTTMVELHVLWHNGYDF